MLIKSKAVSSVEATKSKYSNCIISICPATYINYLQKLKVNLLRVPGFHPEVTAGTRKQHNKAGHQKTGIRVDDFSVFSDH